MEGNTDGYNRIIWYRENKQDIIQTCATGYTRTVNSGGYNLRSILQMADILFIPLGTMQTCIVPVISFNYAAHNIERCKRTLWDSVLFGEILMVFGTLCFLTIPGPMLRVFSSDPLVIEIGKVGFRIIGISFLPMVTSLIFPVFFQAVGSSMKSSLLTVIRTVVLFVPLGFLFSRFGLNWFWLTFPITEVITSLVGARFYRQFLVKGRDTDESVDY